MTPARQRLAALERSLSPVRVLSGPATWRGVAALWREIIGDVDPALLARVDEIGRRPDPAPGEAPATQALLVLSCPSACRVATEVIARLSCGY